MKVSIDETALYLQDTTHDVNRVSTYRCLLPRSGVPFNEEVGPSSLANETGGEIRSSFLVLVGRKERPQSCCSFLPAYLAAKKQHSSSKL